MAGVNGQGNNGALWKSIAIGGVSVILLVQIWIDVDHMRVSQEQSSHSANVEKIDRLDRDMQDMRQKYALLEQRMNTQDTKIIELEKQLSARLQTMSQRLLSVNNRLDTFSGIKRGTYPEPE